MFCPGATEGGPVLLMERSDCAPTFVVAEALLSELSGSGVVELTVAVFVTLPENDGEVL